MCCEQLVCARCHGMVADAQCPMCRQARAELHGELRGLAAIPRPLLAALFTLLVLLSLLARHWG